MTLHRYPQPKSFDLTNLVEFPVKLRPVPVKPYFFDIAYNYFGLEDAVEETKKEVLTPVKEKEPEQPAKKGWFWR
jgi:signal recognition particle subunit SRP68